MSKKATKRAGRPRKSENPTNAVTVFLTDEAKTALDAAVERTGMTYRSFVSKAMEWFVNQDITSQSMALGLIDQKHMKSIAEMITG